MSFAAQPETAHSTSNAHRFGRWRLMILASFLVIVLQWVAGPETAKAHAAFERSDPEPNSIIAESPKAIQIWFTEPLEFDYSEATLFDQQGNVLEGVSSGPAEADNSLLMTVETTLGRGTYSVAWQNLSSADGHENSGYFAFTIGSQADVANVVAPVIETSDTPLWLRAASRWFVLLAIAPLIAAWIIWLVVLFPSTRSDPRLQSTLHLRLRRIVALAFFLALAANLFALVVQASTLTGGSLAERTRDTLADTRYGDLWLMRIALLILLMVVLRFVDWHVPLHRKGLAALGVAAALAVPLPISLNAHAAALDTGRTTAIVFDWVHISCASVWFGGLLLLLGVLARSVSDPGSINRRGILASALPRFSATALACWALLVVTGVYAAWLHVGSIEALTETPYGKSLLAKLILLAVVLVIAAANLLLITRKAAEESVAENRWSKRLKLAISAEVLLTVVVLFMVGRMTSLQPARDVIAAESSGITVDMMLSDVPATLQITPGAAGPNHITLDVSGEPLPDETEAVIRYAYESEELGGKEVPLERALGNLFEYHGSEMSIAGEWDLEVIVRQIGSFNYVGDTSVEILEAPPAPVQPPWRFSSHSIVALLMVAIGVIGLVVAWRAGKGRMRLETAGIAVIALVFGAGIMASDRIQPAGVGIDYGLQNPIPATSNSVARGQVVYENSCLVCHGPDGKGDGPGGDALVPPPADFTAGHAKVHTDGEFFSWIENGKPGTGMPAFGDDLSDEEIWDVINFIHTEFQDQPLTDAPPAGTPESD